MVPNSRSFSHGTLCGTAPDLSKAPNIPPLHSQSDMVGFGLGPWRHLGPGRNIQATRPASALPHQSCARSAGDRRVPRALFLLRRCDRSAGAMASVENAAGATGRGRAHGTEQLSVSVPHLHNDLLRVRTRAVRQGRARCGVGPDPCYLRDANSSQPLVVAAVPLWSDGVDLEVADLQETATNAPVS